MHEDTVVAALLRVLVVGDHVVLAEVVADYFRREDVSLLVADDGVDALYVAEAMQPGVIILDSSLPGADVLQVCRRLRTRSDAYILILSAGSGAATRIAAFAAGADDFLTEPLSNRELAARIRAILHRSRRAHLGQTVLARACDASSKLMFGPLSVDVARREVFIAGEPISLTRTQFEILATLALRAGRVTTREELLDAVWGPCWSGSANIVNVHIGQLRRRLGDNPARPLLVLNIRGVGYRLARDR